jgi:hypothetical protein
MARATFTNALRFTLRAEAGFPSGGWPAYAPSVEELIAALADAPLDPATVRLVKERRPPTAPG